MTYNPKDHYFRQAKKDGFLARSAYKLDEIQKKHKILRSGQKVLDLGCAPGSWSQVILKIIGPNGYLLGLDLKPISLQAPNATFLVKDIFAMAPEEFSNAPYDVVVSDMAPNTSGIAFRDQALSEELCMKVLAVSDQYLRKGGHMVMKLFMGGGTKAVELEVKKRFSNYFLVRPKSTRTESKEIFLVGLGFRGRTDG